MLRRRCLFPAVSPTLLRQMDMDSLTCAQIWARAAHTKRGPGIIKHVCPRVDSERQKQNCPSPSLTRGLNPGSSDLNSDALTTELRPPVPRSPNQLVPTCLLDPGVAEGSVTKATRISHGRIPNGTIKYATTTPTKKAIKRAR